MGYHFYQLPRHTLEAYYLRIPFRDMWMITALSSAVYMEYRISNPGQYPYPTDYDSYYNMNHDRTPTSTSPLSSRPTTVSEIGRPRPPSSPWSNIHRDRLYNNLMRTSGHNSAVVDPLQTASPLNPYASEFRSLNPHAPEFTSLNPYAPEFIVHPNTWRDEEMHEELKIRKSREEDEAEANVCVVCLHDLSENENDEEETIATLSCGHEYHLHCIKSWLRRKNVCPLCNAVALPPR